MKHTHPYIYIYIKIGDFARDGAFHHSIPSLRYLESDDNVAKLSCVYQLVATPEIN